MADKISNFYLKGFYKALDSVRLSRGLNWKQISEETGVNASTLARMNKDSRPDADSLAALSAWAGLNPADYVSDVTRPSKPDSLAVIYSCLQADPNLTREAADALDEVIKATYERLRKKSP